MSTHWRRTQIHQQALRMGQKNETREAPSSGLTKYCAKDGSKVNKVNGGALPTDLLTEYLTRNERMRHLSTLCFRVIDDQDHRTQSHIITW